MTNKDIHNYNTRRKNDFETSNAKKDLNKNKFFNKSLIDYNNILALDTGRKLKSTGENEKLFNVTDSIITFKKSCEIIYYKQEPKIIGNLHFFSFSLFSLSVLFSFSK